MTSASREMDSGAALRASAISASRSSIRYWSTGAMFGYGVLAPCAMACYAVPSSKPSAIPFITIAPAFIPCMICLLTKDPSVCIASDLPVTQPDFGVAAIL